MLVSRSTSCFPDISIASTLKTATKKQKGKDQLKTCKSIKHKNFSNKARKECSNHHMVTKGMSYLCELAESHHVSSPQTSVKCIRLIVRQLVKPQFYLCSPDLSNSHISFLFLCPKFRNLPLKTSTRHK